MIKCFVIDDEQAAINVLIKFIERTADLKLVGSTTNPVRGISLIQKEEPDVVFLDIQMDGIEVLKRIHTISKVVFCTAYSEFAVQSYDLDVIDYLMKPITFPRFSRAIQRVTDTIYSRPSFSEEIVPNDYMFIKSGQRDIMIRIDLDDIDFVESLNHYVAFHTGNKKTLAYLTLKKLAENLPGSQFMRVHKSYIVALKQIASVNNGELKLKRCAELIPLGVVYKDAFMKKMKGKLMS